MNKFGQLCLLLVLSLTSANLVALPVQLNEADFHSQILGLVTVTEDFEEYTPGIKSSPFVFSNGTYNSTANAAISDFNYFCRDGDQCLTNQGIQGEKKFDNLLAGTTYWGVYMNFINVTDPFNISVNGDSGVLSVNFTPNKQSYFLGFYDALHINSITITNYGIDGSYSNYSFDDITTAGPATPVPEPAIFLLFIFGLIVLVCFRLKKSNQQLFRF
jgi:hypothetical protein